MDRALLPPSSTIPGLLREGAVPGTGKRQHRVVLDRHTATVCGEVWGAKAPWAGLRFAEAEVRTHSLISGQPMAHLGVPFCHPADEPTPSEDCGIHRVRPRIGVGDRLWVQEQWQAWTEFDGTPTSKLPAEMLDRVNCTADGNLWDARRRPAREMRRRSSRLTLIVTAVRIERLQDISEADAAAEGVSFGPVERHRGHNPRWILGQCRDCRHWTTALSPNGGKRPSCPYHYSGHPDPQPSYGDSGQGCSTSFALGDGADETARFQFRYFWNSLHGYSAWENNPFVCVIQFRPVLCNIDSMEASNAL